jgi:SAM-dependent methyltransferase
MGSEVLEAGCGAGRFTELLVEAGAMVHAIDLSGAVEVNLENIGRRSNYVVAQASLLAPPFPLEAFDWVLCLGVLQHTPSPEQSVNALWSMVKPGGWLVIDHYRRSIRGATRLAPLYRMALRRTEPGKAKGIADRLVEVLFPIHWTLRGARFRNFLLSRFSPVLCYFDQYPELTREQHYELSRLDTFDSLTDYYKHTRTPGQIRRLMESLHPADIWVSVGGNGVEARCRKSNAS